jgi:hypothetical protein
MTTQRHATQAYATAGMTRVRGGVFGSCLPVMWSPIANDDTAPKHGQPLRTEESP